MPLGVGRRGVTKFDRESSNGSGKKRFHPQRARLQCYVRSQRLLELGVVESSTISVEIDVGKKGCHRNREEIGQAN